ncbi:MAG TPA: SAF domain-containing protein [Glaciihabitans sp.]|jgi:hypothetical protein|nr:SAF domain-containing protein [Glaciihabitans sp.]
MSTPDTEPERPRRGGGKGKNATPKAKPAGAPANAARANTVQSRVRNKPRPAIIALAVALIIVSGLAAAWIYTTNGNTITVYKAATSIARGDVIEFADLSEVEIAAGQPLPSYLVADREGVEGKTASVDIPEGTLISPNNISSETGLPEGLSIVGISLSPAQLPMYPLVDGDPVRLVDTPVNQGDPPATAPESISATVVRTEVDSVSGDTLVAVSVDYDKAADLAARAATGRVALVLDALPQSTDDQED